MTTPSRLEATLLDIAAMVVAGVVMIGSTASAHGRGRGRGLEHLSPLLLAGVVVCVTAIATRRRWPVASWVAFTVGAGAFLAAGGQLPGVVIAGAVTFFALVQAVPSRQAALLGVLLVPALLASAWGEPWLGVADPETWVFVLAGSALAVAPALVGLIGIERRASRAAARQEELRQAAHDERIRVARDVHDVVGHSLSLIALQSGVALHVFDDNPEQARASLVAIRDSARRSMQELRATLALFRGDEAAELAPVAGLANLPDLVASVRATGRDVSLEDRSPANVPASVGVVAHRVVQESLTNAVRHAPGAAVHVALHGNEHELVVQVTDDGQPVGGIIEGMGLRGMRERVASAGGTLSVQPRPAGGLAVTARLPLSVEES